MAAKKTAGVLGDDLAVNAEQVAGFAAERELPVVWRVAKGSLVNKMILVPLALLMSALLPFLLVPLLLVGGLYLCYEGTEKVLHWLQSRLGHAPEQTVDSPATKSDENEAGDEDKKIQGAIRTDFVLSTEIIVIAIGTVAGASFWSQVVVVSLIAVIMTIGVYGLVAIIVKLDDLGLYLMRRYPRSGFVSGMGKALLSFAPKLMHLLTIVGTIAMFLVGGGIVVHNIVPVHHWGEVLLGSLSSIDLLYSIGLLLFNIVIGFVCGWVVYILVTSLMRFKIKN